VPVGDGRAGPTLRELQGVVGNFGAQRGLLVSWGGFTKGARTEARRLFFQIRLWDSDAVIDKLQDVYDRLPRTSRPISRSGASGPCSPTKGRKLPLCRAGRVMVYPAASGSPDPYACRQCGVEWDDPPCIHRAGGRDRNTAVDRSYCGTEVARTSIGGDGGQ
jgi:restriction endonuclease